MMKIDRVYLDYNAAAPLRPEARDAMLLALDAVGNPSSIHTEGRKARDLIETARASVAAAIGANASQVFFTSGGTEAANTLLTAASGIMACATEHACILDRAKASGAGILSVDRAGVVDVADLKARVKPGMTVAIHAANNETGVLQPLDTIVDAVHGADAVVLCDAVQIVGREAFDARSSNVESAFISGHKFGGPKGVGALYLKQGVDGARPLLRGGGQEKRVRSGTENVAGIAGMAAALKQAIADRSVSQKNALGWQSAVEDGIRRYAPDAVVFGEGASRLANTTCFGVPGLRADMLLIAFDLDGVAVSSGAACSSGRVERSHVLAAMGVTPDLNECVIRVSTGWNTTEQDIGRFLDVFAKICNRRQANRAA